MGETQKPKSDLKKKTHVDTISKGKIHFRVINHYPEMTWKNTKYIEKRLFKIFKKYEQKDV